MKRANTCGSTPNAEHADANGAPVRADRLDLLQRDLLDRFGEAACR